MTALATALEPEFGTAKIFRPFRDVRFAKDKTPNDYFIGGQSGYMYPAAVPADRFPGLMKEMNVLMPLMDEHTVGIMGQPDRGIHIG